MKIKLPSYMTIAFVGIFLVTAFMITATYAYFNSSVIGEGSNMNATAFNQDISITFTDTSNVTMVNAYTGTTFSKQFSVQNTGDSVVYYDIKMIELVNSFVDKDDLTYELTSTTGANINKTIVPSESSTIATSVKIDSGVTHTYTLTVYFEKTTDDQSDNQDKTFSTKISVEASNNINNLISLFADQTLGKALITANTPISDKSVIFTNSPTNGLYYTNNSINGTTVYYFRGSNALNNNVIFGGFCWKVVRTTEKLGIRLIYNGVPSGTSCTNSLGVNSYISQGMYNENAAYNAYVGYMYGTPNSANYTAEHTNTNNSTIKGILDTWYAQNLSSYSDYIEDSYYCNDRKATEFTISSTIYTKRGYGTNNTGYAAEKRINILSPSKPSYNCYNKDDIFTVSDTFGNSALNNPVALLTADEAMFAGLNTVLAQTTNYLYSGADFWTMTPTYNTGTYSYVFYVNSTIQNSRVSTSTYGIRPVITLKNKTKFINGNGTLATPYKVN